MRIHFGLSRTLLARLLLVTLPVLVAPAQARTLAEIKASGVLRLATSADFEPFNFMQGGAPAGFEVDLGEAVARDMGLKVVWVVRPFDGLLRDVNERSDQIDAVLASHAITSTRAQTVDFSRPTYCTGGVILTRRGGPVTSKALVGKNLGAEAGSTYFGFLRKLSFDKTIQVYPNSTAVLQAVATGQVDAIATDKFAALDAVKTFSKANLVIGETLWKEQVAIVVRKGNTELRQALNASLNRLDINGTHTQLGRKYFGQDIGC